MRIWHAVSLGWILIACPARAYAWQSVAAAIPAAEVLPPDLGTRAGGEDWPSFLGPTHDSKSAETGILKVWPPHGPPLVWEQRLETSYGMPTISGGRLFYFTRRGNQAVVTCVNSETGLFLWDFKYPTDYEDLYNYNNGPRGSPIVDGARVYSFGAEGRLHCLRAADGITLWEVDTQARFGVIQNFFGVGSTPLIEGPLLIVPVGGSPAASRDVPPGRLDQVEGNGSGIVAFDKLTGEVRYQLTDELASYASPVAATIAGRRWCFVFARGGLVAFDPATGQQDFHFPWRASLLESVNASNPLVVENRVLISETYGPGAALLQVRPGGYELIWSDLEKRRDKSLQTHWNTAIHHEGFVYGSSGRHENNAELRCLEWATGKVRWSEPGLSRASLMYADGHLICLTEDGELLLLEANPDRFKVVARSTLSRGVPRERLIKKPAWAAPILSHGLLYVRGGDRLVCLDFRAP